MNRSKLVVLAALAVAVALGIPPAFEARQPAPAPVLSPEDALRTFALPPGFRIELVASEPLVQDPVAIDWDPDGRMWVVEMPGYMLDIQATRELEPLGRIVVLDDNDGDGKMDARTVFADGLVLARAIKVLDGGVLVGEPPDLWLMRDTDGDLKMDVKERVSDAYGRREANVEHNANSLLWALDNNIYTSEVDTYFRWRRTGIEARRTRGQWGATQDDVGRVYWNSNPSALHADLVPTPYFQRNPSLTRTRGSYESLGPPDGSLDTVWPAHATPGVNRDTRRES